MICSATKHTSEKIEPLNWSLQNAMNPNEEKKSRVVHISKQSIFTCHKMFLSILVTTKTTSTITVRSKSCIVGRFLSRAGRLPMFTQRLESRVRKIGEKPRKKKRNIVPCIKIWCNRQLKVENIVLPSRAVSSPRRLLRRCPTLRENNRAGGWAGGKLIN